MSLIGSADPFWGAATANSNFCELDYAITRYVAEFINTLTNLVYIIYAIRGLRNLYKKPEVDTLRTLPYWGLMAVGLCSGAFHMSLKYHTQMMDDLAMHFATTPVLHRVLTINSTRRTSIISAWILACALAALLTFHMVTDELILHSVCFGVMVTVIGARTMQLVKQRTAPASDSEARRTIWGVVRFAAFIFNLGFYLWILDQWACKPLQNARSILGLPLGFVLELHGWWHIFTAIGAYLFIAVVDHLVSGEDHRELDDIAWPASWAARSVFAGRGEEKNNKEE
ncbi:alkaline ceramidase family protein [Aspergillus keveii]|uniref:Alkaline ceramidase family protein n=1 Tax=Aspergillus keveii TaxID=714993 RepID=A0ABR4GC29_9EURO